MKRPNTHVYFFQAGGDLGPVKIGWTDNVKARLIQIRCSNPYPVECIFAMPGDIRLETALHDFLHRSRCRGEWFHYTSHVRLAIRCLVNLQDGHIEFFRQAVAWQRVRYIQQLEARRRACADAIERETGIRPSYLDDPCRLPTAYREAFADVLPISSQADAA